MKRYTILTATAILAACTNTGGGSSGVNHGNIKPGRPISIGNGVADNRTFLRLKSSNINNDYEIEGNHYSDTLYRLGHIDKKSGDLYIERWVANGSSYYISCTKPEGCDHKYNNGEMYHVKEKLYIDSPETVYILKLCKNESGCPVHFDEGDDVIEYCRTDGGCGFPSSGINFPLSEFRNGKYVGEYTDENLGYKENHNIALGSQDLSVPLQFSDFGYWNIQVTDAQNGDFVEAITFYAGASDKEVDIKKLIASNALTESQTYTGKAYVGISAGVSMSSETTDKDTSNGFLASGNAQLTLRPSETALNTSLAMNFTEAGWYNVYMNGDGTGLRFEGDVVNDNRFTIAEKPETTNDIDIHYYGNNSAAIPTEAVGTAFIQQVKMQDGLNRDISFSFGATKD